MAEKIEIDKNIVVKEIKEIYEQYGVCTVKLYKKYGTYNPDLFKKRLNQKFDDIKRELGIPCRSYNVKKEDLVEDILKVYNEFGFINKDLYISNGKYSRKPIDRIFGSWNKMLLELKLPINCLINIPEEDLINDIKRIYNEYNVMSATIINWESKYSVEVFTRRFKGFKNLYLKANIPVTFTHSISSNSSVETYLIKKIEKILNKTAEKEKTFPWLKNKKSLRLDAYFDDLKLAIEINGPQHYGQEFNSIAKYQNLKECDQKKEQLCKEHGLKFLKINTSKPLTTEELSNLLYGVICNN